MKYLSHYIKDKRTNLFEKTGAFYAFSNEQFNNSIKKDTQYVNLGNGLFCEKKHYQKLIDGLETTYNDAVNEDLQENGKKNIIWRELANYETQISCDISDTINALEFYPITEKEIEIEYKKYFNHCVKNDLF